MAHSPVWSNRFLRPTSQSLGCCLVESQPRDLSLKARLGKDLAPGCQGEGARVPLFCACGADHFASYGCKGGDWASCYYPGASH